MKSNDLISFEQSIAEAYDRSEIRAPVHLTSGNEDQLIDYFSKNVKPNDWVLCTWRSHYHCLLKGVPPDELRAAIMAGKSISLCFPEYRIVSSAIAGGILPIATGIAMSINRAGGEEKVHCFIGDMMSQSGIWFESVHYANNFNLPIHFIIEDNGLSVCTDTKRTWNSYNPNPKVINRISHYSYTSKWPHCGAGKRIQF